MSRGPSKGFARIDYPRGGHGYVLDGVKVPGVTTIIGKAIPKHLEYSSAEHVARHAAEHPDHFASIPPGGIRDAAKAIFQGEWNRARDKGSAVHAVLERLNVGERVDVAPELDAIVGQYLRFVDDWGVGRSQVMYAEAPLLSATHNYAGTLDLVAYLGDGGPLALLDFKTGPSGVWPEVALQLAAYRYADFVGVGDGGRTLERFPRVDLAAVVWLQDDGYQLLPVDAGPEMFATFLHCVAVAPFADLKREAVIGQPMTPPTKGVAA